MLFTVFVDFSEQFTYEETVKYNITRVDSTMVAETANKLEAGMTTGIKKDGKNQIKYTVSLDGILPGSVQVFTEQTELSEDKTIPTAILKLADTYKGKVFVFDREYRTGEPMSIYTSMNYGLLPG